MAVPVYLNDQDLADLGITTRQIVKAIEHVLIDIRNSTVIVTPKTGVMMNDGRYLMSTMAVSDSRGIVALKSVIANKHNRERQLATVNGGIMLLDSETGQLLATLDANWITGVRTAGMSLVAAIKLANPLSQQIGLIGAGLQAETHLRAFADVFSLKRVTVVGRGKSGINRMKSVAGELKLEFRETDAYTCVSESDIVISAVTRDFSITPFIEASWMKQGAFAAMPDLSLAWHPQSLATFKTLYIDDLAQEQGMDKPIVSLELVTGELADLVIDDVKPDLTSASAFIFRGSAAGDLAVASLAYHRAVGNRKSDIS